jgi:hypothetical protein
MAVVGVFKYHQKQLLHRRLTGSASEASVPGRLRTMRRRNNTLSSTMEEESGRSSRRFTLNRLAPKITRGMREKRGKEERKGEGEEGK